MKRTFLKIKSHSFTYSTLNLCKHVVNSPIQKKHFGLEHFYTFLKKRLKTYKKIMNVGLLKFSQRQRKFFKQTYMTMTQFSIVMHVWVRLKSTRGENFVILSLFELIFFKVRLQDGFELLMCSKIRIMIKMI